MWRGLETRPRVGMGSFDMNAVTRPQVNIEWVEAFYIILFVMKAKLNTFFGDESGASMLLNYSFLPARKRESARLRTVLQHLKHEPVVMAKEELSRQVKMEQQLSNTDTSLSKFWSSKNGTATSSDYEEITTCKNGATTVRPTVISASIVAAVGS
ncbi:hypothetical protein Tco_0527599 [Tanacetum coccineum]